MVASEMKEGRRHQGDEAADEAFSRDDEGATPLRRVLVPAVVKAAQHCIASYRSALKSGGAVADASEAVFRAGSQLARAKHRRDDVEYALFEALQAWDGE